MHNEILSKQDMIDPNGTQSINLITQIHQAASIQHKSFSSRECILDAHKAKSLHSVQQFFLRKQIPADQLRQDVPPGPGPFPQKNLTFDYYSNPITEQQNVTMIDDHSPIANRTAINV